MEDPAELLDSKAELDQEELERLLRENRALKGRLDELERENRLLKQRNFDLSMRYGRNVENRRNPFELEFSEDETPQPENAEEARSSDNNEVSGAGYSVEDSELSGKEPDEAHADLPKVAIDSQVTLTTKSSPRANKRSSIEGATKQRRDKEVAGGNDASVYAEDGDADAEGTSPADKKGTSSGSRDKKDRRPAADKFDITDRDGSAKHNGDGEPSAVPKEKKLGAVRDDDEQRHGGLARRKEARQVKCYAELDGHDGAIYSTMYSPDGSMIASASFDKTLRIWDVGEQKAMAVLDGHTQSVFDVAWRFDSQAVVSASFDRSCVEWDLESSAPRARLPCNGLVQCARYSTHNPNVVYAGDSSGFISILDTRAPAVATKLSNDGAMVNTIYCFNDETRLVSGDRIGEIKMWDVRIGKFMRLVSADAEKRAISHISVVKKETSGTEYMAVNSYDNVVRVYDRVDDPSVPVPRVIHELRGVRSRNWPIKNAFFNPSNISEEQLLGLYRGGSDYYELDTRSQNEMKGLRSMLFLMTGSAEPFAYLYRLSSHSKTVGVDDKTKRGSRQKLEGHSDRVYAVATHPAEIKACTAGADSTIRLWHIPSAGRLLKDGY